LTERNIFSSRETDFKPYSLVSDPTSTVLLYPAFLDEFTRLLQLYKQRYAAYRLQEVPEELKSCRWRFGESSACTSTPI
jgi:hypothetical protein